jgi:hypothetical protein
MAVRKPQSSSFRAADHPVEFLLEQTFLSVSDIALLLHFIKGRDKYDILNQTNFVFI